MTDASVPQPPLDRSRVALWGARVAALVLEHSGDLRSVVAAGASLAVAVIADQVGAKQDARIRDVEKRLSELAAMNVRTRILRGDPVALLRLCLLEETRALWTAVDWKEATDELGWTPERHALAAAELATLELVKVDPNLNAPKGIERTRLRPTAYLRAGPALLPEIDVSGELFRVLEALRDQDDRIAAVALLKETEIPVPHFDLIMRALQDLGHLKGSHSGGDEYGSSMFYSVTPLGRRAFRGDDPL